MPVNRGCGRYVLAAVLLTLEAPILFVLVAGAAVGGALLAVSRVVQSIARSEARPAAPIPLSQAPRTE